MSYQFEAGRIYRMPTHFGPAPGPRQMPDDVVAIRSAVRGVSPRPRVSDRSRGAGAASA